MALFSASGGLPPTRYGYRPPKGAVGVRWVCRADECGHGGPERAGDRWPRRCPACGAAVATDRLAEPWEHEAKRVEIDARANGRPAYGDPHRVRVEARLWAVDDAFRTGRADQVPELVSAMCGVVEAERSEGARYLFDGVWELVRLLVARGEWGVGAGVLGWWRTVVRHDDLEDDEQRTEARMLAASMIHYLEQGPQPPTPYQQAVWELLREFVPVIQDVSTADIDQSWKQLQFTMTGRRNPEDALARELERLAAGDAAAPRRGMPAETALRMEILGRYTAKGMDTTLSAARIWTVCLEPYMGVSPEELARVVLPAGGWTVYGASRCLRELGVHDENGQAYGAIWDAGLDFYRSTGVGSAHLSFNDHQRWVQRHGPNSW